MFKRSAAQTLLYHDTFIGGVTTGGYSPDYNGSGSGSFTIVMPIGSTIKKAYLLAGRHGNAANLNVSLNALNLSFNSTNLVSLPFQSPLYGGASGVHAIDITLLINPNVVNYTLTVPAQLSTGYRYQDFYLFVAYENPSLTNTSVSIFVNAQDFNSNVVWNLINPTPLNTANDVGLSLFTGYSCNSGSDGENVTVNGTFIGTYGGPDFNSGACGGPMGSFSYQTNVLTGLGDDNANLSISGPDNLSEISSLVPNGSSNFNILFNAVANDASNAIWAVVLTNGSSCALNWSINSSNIVCHGDTNGSISATAVGAPGPVSYFLQPTNQINTTGQFVNLLAGIYTVLATDANGCSSTTTITIQDPPLLQINSLGSTTPTCTPGNDGTITINAIGGTPSYTYSIGGINQASNVFNNLSAGSYTVLVTDANSCTTFSALNILLPSSPNITSLSSTDVLCFNGNTGSISTLAMGGNGLLNYYLQPNNQNNSNGQFNNLLAGIYTITVSDANNCSMSSSITILEPNLLTWLPPNINNLNCNGSANSSITISATGGIGTLNYNLLPNNITTNTGQFTSLTSGNYTITAIDANACTLTTIIQINETTIIAFAGNDTIICKGDSVLLNASGGYYYSWLPALNMICDTCQSTIVYPNSNTTYTLITSNSSLNCIDTAYITVEIREPIDLKFGILNDSVCTGTEIKLFDTILNANSFVWDMNNGIQIDTTHNPIYVYPNAGNYIVTLNGFSDYCSSKTYSLPVKIFDYPLIKLGADTVFCFSSSSWMEIKDLLPTSDEYEWNTGSNAQSILINSPGLYSLSKSNIIGCTSEDTILVDTKCNTFIPNAFSPNGDGINDFFFSDFLFGNIDGKISFKIYNRWGGIVHTTENISNYAWDGKYKGVEQPIGVYFYLLEVTYSNNQKIIFKGDVSLIR